MLKRSLGGFYETFYEKGILQAFALVLAFSVVGCATPDAGLGNGGSSEIKIDKKRT